MLAAGLVGCAHDPPPKSSPPTAVTVAAVPTVSAPPAAAPEAPAAGDEIIGTLATSKGMVSLGEVLLNVHDVEAHLGKDWRRHLGRRVRAHGRRTVYQCGPQEQCLIDGSIPLLTEVSDVSLCKGKVDCPLSEADVERCVASCKVESDRCDEAAGKETDAQRRCGCAWVSCEDGCKDDGEVLFLCR